MAQETATTTTRTATLLALADRCEAASGPDRELDGAIALAAYPGLSRSGDKWYLTGTHVRIEDYTASLDAALGLVPPGDGFMLRYHETAVGMRATASVLGTSPRGDTWDHSAATPALALCAAALRARAALA